MNTAIQDVLLVAILLFFVLGHNYLVDSYIIYSIARALTCNNRVEKKQDELLNLRSMKTLQQAQE
jgi:hypothetical protein